MASLITLGRIKMAIAALAVVGAGFMGYLTYLHYSGSSSAVCDLSEGLSCSFVNTSVFSELLGVPLSILGILYFLAVAVMMLAPIWPDPFRDTILFTLFSLVFGLYLSGIELLVLDSFCLFCELSKVLMAVILALALQGAKLAGERLRWDMVIGVAIVGLVFSGAAYALQREPAPSLSDAEVTAVAECLSEKDVVMYGAYWCPNCKRQKQWFGDAFSRIEEIECDPRGENAQPERCVARDIAKTPTWIQEVDGEEVSRLTGAAPVAELGAYFGCP